MISWFPRNATSRQRFRMSSKSSIPRASRDPDPHNPPKSPSCRRHRMQVRSATPKCGQATVNLSDSKLAHEWMDEGRDRKMVSDFDPTRQTVVASGEQCLQTR